MNRSRLAPATLVVVYFSLFAVVWATLAVSLLDVDATEIASGSTHQHAARLHVLVIELALMVHAATIALLAWKANRWLFMHGMLAVVASGLPLPLLVRELWFIPAFLYVIAIVHVWLACRHESIGRLQTTTRRRVAQSEAA